MSTDSLVEVVLARDVMTGNWTDAGTWSGSIADGTGSTANFTGVNISANQTITLTAPQTIGNIIFTDATISSNNLTISGANILTLDVASGAPVITERFVVWTTNPSRCEGLSKSGLGTLTLSGTNNYTGGTTVTAGTLSLTSANTHTGNTAITATTEGTLRLENIGAVQNSALVSISRRGSPAGREELPREAATRWRGWPSVLL